MRILLTIVFSLIVLSRAQAHAFLDHADPRVGSTLHSGPQQVKLWMTEELEAAFSKVQVFDVTGREIDGRNTKVIGATMSVSVPVLAPGIYKVAWKAVATDTHKTTGTFKFTVQ